MSIQVLIPKTATSLSSLIHFLVRTLTLSQLLIKTWCLWTNPIPKCLLRDNLPLIFQGKLPFSKLRATTTHQWTSSGCRNLLTSRSMMNKLPTVLREFRVSLSLHNSVILTSMNSKRNWSMTSEFSRSISNRTAASTWIPHWWRMAPKDSRLLCLLQG